MRKSRFSLFHIVNYTLMFLFMLSILYPFVYLINLSFSTAGNIYAAKNPFFLWPEGFTWEAYRKLFSMEYIYTGYFNTIFRTLIGTALSIACMSFAAYSLSKKTLPHYKLLTTFVVVTIFFNGGIIPNFLLMRNLHLLDSFWGLVFNPLGPTVLVNGFYLLILRNFFMGIPESLEESAKIDGAGDIRIFFQIIIPLSLPAIATIGLWQAVNFWNGWFDSFIFMHSTDKHVIAVHIRRLVIEQNAAMNETLAGLAQNQQFDMPTPESIRAAAIMVTTIPILCVYPFIQKYFVKGVTVGAVKG